MATTANPPPGAMPVDDNRPSSDPFLTQPLDDKRHRYSGFDNTLFSLYSNGSPLQAKRALEAHLSETERRLQDASKLGTILVKQRKELAEKLREVESQQQQDEIAPDLKQKLLELENEVNEVSRDTARAFIQKNRVASGEPADTATNPSIFSSDARYSPSKVQAPSRKQRNQTPSRVNDLKLATDISTSLLAQVRDLQAAVAEKDDALKTATADKDQLEQDYEALRLRLRALDESEQRFKDENWSLETQLHELTAAQKESSDREHRLTNNLNLTTTSKAALEREFEELKQAHGKLAEDHSTAQKHHEVELGTLKRNAAADDSEKTTLQKKVEDLISQNKELAMAVSYRLGAQSRAASGEHGIDADDLREDQTTPGNSPPGSPSKATPRHGPLQAETLQSSLNHAHRQIQNLRNQLHREKTEKIEYRRLLQEARDELEAKRNGVDSGKKRKSSKDQDLLKKTGRLDRLGAARESREDILLEDPDWEDHEGAEDTPSKTRTIPGAYLSANDRDSGVDATTDAYVTATDQSDAFETANEREASATETDAFQTGAETLDGNSSDELTETEAGPSTGAAIKKRPSNLNRYSFQSTASNSGDDFDEFDIRTPVQQNQPKYKLRISRGGQRRASGRAVSDGPQDSPAGFDSPAASFASNSSTPQAPGQSLFAELGNLSDPETEEGTPRSANGLSAVNSPEFIKKSPAPSRLRDAASFDEKPKVAMVDSSMMTEPWEPESKSMLANAADVAGAALAGGVGFVLGRGSKSDAEPEATAIDKAIPSDSSEPSSMLSVPTEPSENSTAPTEALSSPAATAEHIPVTEPSVAPMAIEKPKLSISPMLSQHTEPISPVAAPIPVQPVQPLQVSNIVSQHSELVEKKKDIEQPIAPVEVKKEIPQTLSHSAVLFQHTEPKEPLPASVQLPQPIEKPVIPLAFSTIIHQESKPVEPPRPVMTVMTNQSTATDLAPPVPERASRPAKSGILGAMLGGRKQLGETSIAEDETSQPPKSAGKEVAEASAAAAVGAIVASEVRRPFRQIDGNAPPSPERKPTKEGPKLASKPFSLPVNESTQTMLSSKEIDRLLKGKSAVIAPIELPQASPSKTQVYGSTSPRKSRDSVNTVERVPRRPGSAGSLRSRPATPPPPLPIEARQTIERAAQKTPGTVPATQVGVMGPPMLPASAYRGSMQFRPRTPVSNVPASPSAKGHTVRASVSTTGGRSPATTTRRSSVSSFASELDHRFNITTQNMGGQFSDPNITDPRMIQAITQTMIGEFMWKYTRKAGREEISSTRHRRFFWVHPYTRTLYWSEQDPSVGRTQLKAKSVAIEAVRVVSDDNPMPPGLHRKSLIVITPGRSLKFTAPTAQRHETWFNALSYLLLRSGNDQEEDGGMTAEDVAEFNPTSGYFRSSSRATGRSRMSVSSYATARTVSPQRQQNATLRAPSAASQRTSRSQSQQPSGSVTSRLSSIGGMFRSSSSVRGSMTSRHSKQQVYEAAVSEAADSAEELRKQIEEQERAADKLENVRACCDGKHDVGSLSRNGRHGKVGFHSHSHDHVHSHA